jgi:hypothetical protein
LQIPKPNAEKWQPITVSAKRIKKKSDQIQLLFHEKNLYSDNIFFYAVRHKRNSTFAYTNRILAYAQVLMIIPTGRQSPNRK